MARFEFDDFGRPELFGEQGEFLGSQADYDYFKCAVCEQEFPGLAKEDAAQNHEVEGLDHEFTPVD